MCKKFCLQVKICKNATFLKDADALYQWAMNNKGQDKPIIISCADGVSQVFDMHYEEVHSYYDFFNAGADGVLTAFMDKQRQVELAKEVGFATPISACYTNKDSVGDFSTFPCIVKPLQSYVGGKHIWHCNNTKELQDVVISVPDGVMLQVQELIKMSMRLCYQDLLPKTKSLFRVIF